MSGSGENGALEDVDGRPSGKRRVPVGEDDRQKLGRKGERIAVRYLKGKGYKVLHRNWGSSLGEIDIIAREGGKLCFVEVKTRSGKDFGGALEAVGPAKQSQIVRAALGFLMQHKLPVQDCRFDVVAVQLNAEGEAECELVQDAFSAAAFYKY